MKKAQYLGLALMTGLCMSPAFAQDGASDLDETKFNHVGAWSNVLLYQKYEKPFWEELLSEASDGKLTASVTSFDQLGIEGDQVFRLLQKGVFDIGATLPDYLIQDVPAMGGVDVPALTTEAEETAEAAMAFKPVLKDIIRENFDAELLAVAPNSRQAVYCKDPVESLADLDGRKIRTGGRYEAIFLKALGAEGVTMSFSEVSGAMENGLLDCAITGIIGGYNASWYEIADYVYNMPIGGYDHVATAVNGKVWEGLGKETQDWLKKEVAENYEKTSWENSTSETEEAISCLTGEGDCSWGESANMTLVEPTEDDVALAKKILEEQVLPAWVKATDKKWVERWNETVAPIVGVEAAM